MNKDLNTQPERVILYVDPAKLKPLKGYVDVYSDSIDIDVLAFALKIKGMIQPIVINPRYEIIAGVKRNFAAIAIGMNPVPVIIANEEYEQYEEQEYSKIDIVFGNISRIKSYAIIMSEIDAIRPFLSELKKKYSHADLQEKFPIGMIDKNRWDVVKLLSRIYNIKPSSLKKLLHIHKYNSQIIHEIDAGKLSIDKAYKETISDSLEENEKPYKIIKIYCETCGESTEKRVMKIEPEFETFHTMVIVKKKMITNWKRSIVQLSQKEIENHDDLYAVEKIFIGALNDCPLLIPEPLFNDCSPNTVTDSDSQNHETGSTSLSDNPTEAAILDSGTPENKADSASFIKDDLGKPTTDETLNSEYHEAKS